MHSHWFLLITYLHLYKAQIQTKRLNSRRPGVLLIKEVANKTFSLYLFGNAFIFKR